MKTSSKRLKWYLIIAYVLAYIFQIIGSVAKVKQVGGEMTAQGIFTAMMTIAMVTPTVAALVSAKISGERLGVAFRPKLKGRLRWYAAAMFLPAVLGTLGAVLYFLVCRGNFDGSMPMLRQSIETSAAQGQNTAGLTPAIMLAVTFLGCVTVIPFINGIPALGEEIGWRGYMTPAIVERLGRRKGLVVSGVIWAAWHWPCIAIAGYDFGTGYPLYPIPGLLAMCFACTALGILLSLLYEKTDSVLAPALCHGAMNGFLTIPQAFLKPGVKSLVLGPALGVLSMLPAAVLAAVVLFRSKEEKA